MANLAAVKFDGPGYGAIVPRKLAELIPYAKNPRVHDAAQVELLKRSMREFGFTDPILVDETGEIIGGHGRLQAAQALGIAEVPTQVVTGWTEAKKRAYRILENKAVERGGWHDEFLAEETAWLQSDGFDLQLTGFTDEELGVMLAEPEAEPVEDDGPESKTELADELQRKWGTALGQLWTIGRNHRLMCGSSEDPEAVARLLNGEKPLLMATDPPYGVDYDPQWRNERLGIDSAKGGVIAGDERADWSSVWRLWAVPVLYIWHGSLRSVDVANSLAAADYDIRNQIIWNKTVMVISRGAYHWKHEPCWYAVKKGFTANWCGDRSQSTVWDCGNGAGSGRTGESADNFEADHGSQKPVELFRRPIRNHTEIGDLIAEPFAGSGSQFVAAEQLHRRCVGMELEPKYVAVILERMSEMGLQPKLV